MCQKRKMPFVVVKVKVLCEAVMKEGLCNRNLKEAVIVVGDSSNSSSSSSSSSSTTT